MARRPTPDPTIGERIRTRRQLREWSVRYAASRTTISHATWSRIERGKQAADNRFVLAEIAAALECTPQELTGTLVPAADREAMAAQTSLYAIRQALVDIDLSEPPGPAARPVRPAAELAREAALLRARWRACDYAGTTRLLPGLLRDLHAAARGPDPAPALALLCDAAIAASSTVRQLGHPAEAWLAAERARDVAEAAADPVLVGHAAYIRALAATSCGSYTRSLTLAERTADDLRPHLGRPGGLELYGMLHLVAACASRALHRTDDCGNRLAEAAEIAERAGETTTLGLFFGPTNVAFWQIGIEADSGEAGRAVGLAQRTNPAVIDANNRQVYFYTDLARACARVSGKDREAVRYLLTAERLAPQHVHSAALVRETARVLLARAGRASDGAALRGLCGRLGLAEQ